MSTLSRRRAGSYVHEVRDPIHGFIVYDDLEKELINSRAFQRLRRIKQLALANMIYPGASHTRFEHSLGVMEIASRLFDTLIEKGGHKLLDALGIVRDGSKTRLRRILRIAALLHDVGHLPYSHASEDSLLPGGHEAMTAKLIRETEIREIIEHDYYQAGINVERDIIPVAIGPEHAEVSLTAEHQFLTELLTGVFGADRMDYLLRDSLHSGVKYGEFDLDRLIRTLTFVREDDMEGPVVAVEQGGVHAAEGLILARYFMFQQVYCHPLRRMYDEHLGRFLKEVMDQREWPAWPSEPEEFLAWDDSRVKSLIHEQFRQGESRWAEALAGRLHFKTVFQAPEGGVQEYQRHFVELVEVLEEHFEDDVHVDSMYRVLIRDPELTVKVLSHSGKISNWLTESALFEMLPPIAFLRIYADRVPKLLEGVELMVKEFFQSKLGETKGG